MTRVIYSEDDVKQVEERGGRGGKGRWTVGSGKRCVGERRV